MNIVAEGSIFTIGAHICLEILGPLLYTWELITSNSLYYRGSSLYKSFLNNLLDVCLYMGRIYVFLVKYHSDGDLLFDEKYVNHSHVYKL